MMSSCTSHAVNILEIYDYNAQHLVRTHASRLPAGDPRRDERITRKDAPDRQTMCS